MCNVCALHFALTFLLSSVDHGFAVWNSKHPISIAYRNLLEALDAEEDLACEDEQPEHKKRCGGGGGG